MNYSLKSRRNPPPNGFLFTERPTNWQNWTIAPETVWDFDGLVRAIQNHRKANPRFGLSTDPGKIADEIDFQNSQRLLRMPGAAAQYLVSDAVAPPNPTSPPSPIPGALAAAGDLLVKMASGAGVLVDWLGEGGRPVDPVLAEKRARICAIEQRPGRDKPGCPKNGAGSLTRYFTIPAANLIQKQLEQRQEMKLSTSYDDKLGICEACGCPMRLKAHVPIDFIKSHLPEQVRADLDPQCWILSELSPT